MKNLLILLLISIALPVYSQVTNEEISVLEKLGLFNAQTSKVKISNPRTEIKNLFKKHEKFTNSRNIEGLKTIYADKYISYDGFSKDVYMNLAEKTWKTYKALRYTCIIKSIEFTDENQAFVDTEEYINGLSQAETKYIKEGYGLLENASRCIYVLEKINGRWQIVSDNIYYEQTVLNYGTAKFIPSSLVSPAQVNSDTNYTISLNVTPPKDSIVIATIGKENITYPQKSAEEVFRKLSEYNNLERVVKSNKDNLNEYAVSFFVIMKASAENALDLVEMKVSGVGMAMNRVNVVPKNNFIRKDNEKSEKH